MESHRIPLTTHEAARHDLRARRVARVKFVALPLPMPIPVDYQQALAQGTGARAQPAMTLLSLLSRVIGRLVAARP